MLLMCYERTALPQWAVVFALVAMSPVPLALPSAVALAAIGLLGSAVLLRRWGRAQLSAPVPATVL